MSRSATSGADALRHFDALFSESDDPWRYRTSWYEHRKRAVLLSALPRQHYRSGCEPGCANGELSAALALRCESLIVSDGSDRAVALARARLQPFGNVIVERATMPRDWPEGREFDLIVLSEIGYYLPDAELADLLDRCVSSFANDWTLIACHWRHDEADFHRTGDEVHRLMATRFARPARVHHLEEDFVLDVWSVAP